MTNLLPALTCSLLLVTLSGCGDPSTLDLDNDGLIGADDCNDSNPEVGEPLAWYPDEDKDGFGDIELEVRACSAPDGTVSVGGDCDDSDATIHPEAVEVCDAADNDCDGTTDLDAADALEWFEDADSDGFGNQSITFLACEQPENHVDDNTDCDDSDPGVFPGATETYYDGIDSNCDPSDDNDADGDGFNKEGYGGDDCDDDNPAVNTGATETCDGLDNDCDALTLEDGLVSIASQNFNSINAASAAAAMNATINVCPGTYFESVTIDTSVQLIGLGGPNSTTISAATNADAALIVTADDVSIEGFLLTGGAGHLVNGKLLGGAVYSAAQSGTLSITNSVILNNLADEGAGIYSTTALLLTDVIVDGNSASGPGGGVYIDGDLTLRTTTVRHNAASEGGGIYLDGSLHTVSLDSTSTLEQNSAEENGGGLFLCDECNLDSGVIRDNTAELGGGIYLTPPAATTSAPRTISGTEVRANTATTEGGGIYANGGLQLVAGEVAENRATAQLTGSGGGIYANTGAIKLSGGAIVHLNSAARGGGIFAMGAALEGGLYESNTATDSGGGIFISSDMGTSMARLTFNENEATNKGGAIFSESYFKSVDLVISSNRATQGGGAFMAAEGAGTFDAAVLIGNMATFGGGAFVEQGTLTFLVSDLGDGNSDNLPEDVYIGNAFGEPFHGYANNTNLTCDAALGTCL